MCVTASSLRTYCSASAVRSSRQGHAETNAPEHSSLKVSPGNTTDSYEVNQAVPGTRHGSAATTSSVRIHPLTDGFPEPSVSHHPRKRRGDVQMFYTTTNITSRRANSRREDPAAEVLLSLLCFVLCYVHSSRCFSVSFCLFFS